MKYSVTFQPQNTTTHTPEGTTVFNAANWLGIAIDSTCGGRGTCGKCTVQMQTGALAPTEADRKYLTPAELYEGWRLSCRALVHTDCLVDVSRMMTWPKAALSNDRRTTVVIPFTGITAFMEVLQKISTTF